MMPRLVVSQDRVGMLCLKLVLLTLSVVEVSTRTWARYWPGVKSVRDLRTYEYPEMAVEDLGEKSVGVAFSGGGSRAFTAALGQMNAFQNLGIWSELRYAAGTSGGSWALAAYSYRNRSSAELLGPIVGPSSLTPSELQKVYKGSARSFPSQAKVDYVNIEGDKWLDASWETFVGPAGVPKDTSLSSERHQRDPFPLFSMTMIGPASLTPLDNNSSQSTLRTLTATPLYVGTPLESRVKYSKLRRFTVGGFVEPAIFGCDGLHRVSSEDHILATDDDCRGLSVGDAAGFSSFYSGLAYANVLGSTANLEVGLHRTYYSKKETKRILFSAGGNRENVHLSGLLQRGVQRIVALYNSEQPLNLSWDPTLRPPTTTDITDDLTNFFGLDVRPSFENPTYNYIGLQVFPQKDFIPLALALQQSVRAGLGGVATSQHVTVSNDLLGVPAGLRVNVTWVYLSPSPLWFSLLPNETQTNLRDLIEFHNFPHFDTLNLILNTMQVNALTDLTSWVLLQNFHDHLSDIVSSDDTDLRPSEVLRTTTPAAAVVH